MDKATIRKLDALEDYAEISVTVMRDFYTVAVFNNCVFRQRAPQPVGLAWEIQARKTGKVSLFILPHYEAQFTEFDGDKCPRLQVIIMDSKEPLVDPDRVRAAAAEAGAEDFSQADLDEFMETVKGLAQRGIITLPKASKAVAHG